MTSCPSLAGTEECGTQASLDRSKLEEKEKNPKGWAGAWQRKGACQGDCHYFAVSLMSTAAVFPGFVLSGIPQ